MDHRLDHRRDVSLRTSQASGAQLFFSMDVAEAHFFDQNLMAFLPDVVIHSLSDFTKNVGFTSANFLNIIQNYW